MGRGPLVIGVTLTPKRTLTTTAVKQYVDPHPTEGGVDIVSEGASTVHWTNCQPSLVSADPPSCALTVLGRLFAMVPWCHRSTKKGGRAKLLSRVVVLN